MDVLLFILSFVIILLGCEFFTNAVEWLGKRYNLSEGAVGSVLAAVGTAMPETLIPLIAIIFVGGQAGEDIGVGAILGAPFMLATLAMFVCGLALFLFAKRRGTRTLHINGKLIRRDLRFFLLCYSLAVVAAFMPPDMQAIRWIIGFVLIPIYIYYTYVTVKKREGACETGDLKCLHFQNYADRLRGNRPENGNPDEVSILDFAREIVALTGSRSKVICVPKPKNFEDDPKLRKPDITKARALLGWEPQVPRREGLTRTLEYFRKKVGA